MSERREVPRYLFNSHGTLLMGTDGTSLNITIHSISVRGCRANAPGAPPPGEKCQLRIEWEGRQFRAEAKVVWRKASGEAGFTFLSVDQESLGVLRRICSNLQIEPVSDYPGKPSLSTPKKS